MSARPDLIKYCVWRYQHFPNKEEIINNIEIQKVVYSITTPDRGWTDPLIEERLGSVRMRTNVLKAKLQEEEKPDDDAPLLPEKCYVSQFVSRSKMGASGQVYKSVHDYYVSWPKIKDMFLADDDKPSFLDPLASNRAYHEESKETADERINLSRLSSKHRVILRLRLLYNRNQFGSQLAQAQFSNMGLLASSNQPNNSVGQNWEQGM